MKTLGQWKYITAFLEMALDGGEWSAKCPCCFTAKEIAPLPSYLYPLFRRLDEPRAVLDIVVK
jgi:hypothetical protein